MAENLRGANWNLALSLCRGQWNSEHAVVASGRLPLMKKRVSAAVLLRGGAVVVLQRALAAGPFPFEGYKQATRPNAELVRRATQSSHIRIMVVGMFLLSDNLGLVAKITVTPATTARRQRFIAVGGRGNEVVKRGK